MYGTINNICAGLLAGVSTERKVTILVWTEADVRERLCNDELWPEVAQDMLAEISQAHDVKALGFTDDELASMCERIQQEHEKKKVTVCVEQLNVVLKMAGAELQRIADDADNNAESRARFNGMIDDYAALKALEKAIQ